MTKACVDCGFWKRTEPGDDIRGWGKCRREEDSDNLIRGGHLGCRHWVRYSYECQGCVYWAWAIPDLRDDRTHGHCEYKGGKYPGRLLSKNRRGCSDWKCRGCFNPACGLQVEEGKISESEAERLWRGYLARLVDRLEADRKTKKKRRWGIYHEKYGWLGTGRGVDFVTSRKKDARREAVEWLERYGWSIKQYPRPAEED